jgi:serine/threonine protein kinase
LLVLAIESQSEPIAGYRLLERLGQGGFGEVWKAQAPGGVLKAIKIVYGCLHGLDGDEARVRQELKSLDRVKTVRHPFILALDRYDVVGDQLVIVMELADCSLWDRFQECRAKGMPGIPRDDLLRYMEETAEALDLMNNVHQLQHLDIKPQNLFLLYNHIKVGDFGLVKDLEERQARLTSGVTALYAAPETFEGVATSFCDQYSLAIVYQELLTGYLPFSGTNARQLMLQHLQSKPNLDQLPSQDREPIAKALSKKPEHRYRCCADLVRALLRRNRAEAEELSNRTASKPEVLEDTPRPVSATPTTRYAKQPPATPAQIEQTGEGVLFPALVIGLGGHGLRVLQQLRRTLHKRFSTPLPNIRFLHLDTDPDVLTSLERTDPDATVTEREVLLARLQRPGQYLRPGRERQTLQDWLPVTGLTRLPRDQVTTAGWRALGRLAFASNFGTIAARLRAELETCLAPDALTAAADHTGLGARTNWPRIYVVTSLAGGTGSGVFVDLAYALRHLLRQLGFNQQEIIGLALLPPVERGQVEQGAGGRSQGPGKNRILQTVTPRPLAPSSSAEHLAQRSPGLMATTNCYAALTELNYFAAPQTVYQATYFGQASIADREPPLSRCMLLPLPPERSGPEALRELVALAGDYLCRDLTMPLGRVADICRCGSPAFTKDQRTAMTESTTGRDTARQPGLTYHTFGAYWFSAPHRLLLQRIAQCLCHRLVQGWSLGDRQAQAAAVQAWVDSHMAAHDLTPQGLTQRLQHACPPVSDQQPDALVEATVRAWADGGASQVRRRPAATDAVLAEIKRLVWPQGGSSTPIDQALEQAVAAVSRAVEQPLGDLALCVLSEPQFRLTGTEDAVQQELVDALRKAGREQKSLSETLAEQAAGQERSIVPLCQTLHERSFLGGGKRSRAAEELLRLIPRYARNLYQSRLAWHSAALYEKLVEDLSRYIREVRCCRPRIEQFLHSFRDPATNGQPEVDLGLGKYLLPPGCRTLSEAATQFLAHLSPEELGHLEQRVQALIGQALHAHVHVCTAPADFFKNLKETVYEEVAAFAETQLRRAHAAEVYLEQHADDGAALADLAGAYDAAVPELTGTRLASPQEIRILAVPSGPEGEHFRRLVQEALPATKFTPAESTDDIIFYREPTDLKLASLPQMGPPAQEAYRQFSDDTPFTLHSRTDITDWQPPA